MCPAMLASRWFKVKYNCQIGEKLKVGKKNVSVAASNIFKCNLIFLNPFLMGLLYF